MGRAERNPPNPINGSEVNNWGMWKNALGVGFFPTPGFTWGYSHSTPSGLCALIILVDLIGKESHFLWLFLSTLILLGPQLFAGLYALIILVGAHFHFHGGEVQRITWINE